MINRSVLTGRLTRDPELRYTGSGTAFCSFTLAVDRQFKNQNNEREADFINCVIWRKSADNFANFTHKGSLVGIDGRLQSRSYDDKNGNHVYVTEVVVDNFALLESKKQNNDQQQGNYPSQQNYKQSQSQGDGQVFNQRQAAPKSYQQETQPKIDLSSLPFNSGRNSTQPAAPIQGPKQTTLGDVPF